MLSKKPCPSLSARLSFGFNPAAHARSSVSGAHIGTGNFFEAVDTVGVTGERMDSGLSLQRDGEREQEFDIASASAVARAP